MLVTKKLTKTYDRQQTKFDAVHEVDFSLDAGQLCALTGPSGCGKSTFFHLISGLTHADSGEILFEGKDLCKLSAKEWTHLRATQISYVLQRNLAWKRWRRIIRPTFPAVNAAASQ